MKKQIYFISFIFLFPCSELFTQANYKSFYLKGKIDGIFSGELYVHAESNNGKVLIDSFGFVGNEMFSHQIKNFKAPGFIYLKSSSGNLPQSFNIFFISIDADTIEFEATNDSTIIKKDFANKALFEFIMECETKMRSLIYDKKDLDKLQKKEAIIYKKLNKVKATKALADYVFIFNEIFLSEYTKKMNINKIKEWLEMINKNPDLLNTNIVGKVFGSFTSFIEYYQLPKEKVERIFEDSFVKLYSNLNVSNELKLKFGNEYAEYLGNHKYFSALGNYITNYANFFTMPVYQNNTKRLDPGVNIGNIFGKNILGETVNINNFHTDYKLIIIWSPDCGHCLEAIPEMNELFKKHQTKNISFVSFSMLKFDSGFVNPFDWKNSFSILNGWQNDFIVKYGLSYTPVFLLLNKKNEIIELDTEVGPLNLKLSKLFN